MSSALWPPGSGGTLWLFLIPFGGGIPAGVLFARSRALDWRLMEGLYLVSDVILACVFEPVMRLVLDAARTRPGLARVTDALRAAVKQTLALYGNSGGPIALILISFGVDPMTGRAATAAAGHGPVPGWTLAIIGDMLYFTMIMASTLWLSAILGDGRWATGTILVVMFVAPLLFRRWKERKK